MKTKLLLLLFVVTISFGQQRTCGMQDHMYKIMFNPVLKKQYEERQAKFEVEYQKLLNNPTSRNRLLSPNATIIIPVAIHFPSVSGATLEATKVLYRNFAQTQIDVINADFNATNSDLSNWITASAFYSGVIVGNLDVQFVIATQNHPAGTGLVNGIKAITFGTNFLANADSDPTWAGYMNFVIRDLGSNLLGYSPLSGSPAAGQTVVMNTWCYGTGSGVPGTPYVPAVPFNLGRTVTHELGHFFNLNHTFKSATSSATNCSGADADGIADTPKQAAATYGCIAAGSRNACVSPQKVLSMNYMDYSDDACMYMFTAGQATRMLAWYNTISSQLLTNVLANNDFVKNNFSIAPNPNKGIFSIQLSEAIDNYTVVIMDALGREIFNAEYNQTSDLVQNIQLDNALSGMYFVTIQSKGAQITKKIIIE